MRTLIGLFLVASIATMVVLWFVERPGTVLVDWMGWQVTTSVATGALALMAATFILVSIWRFAMWLWLTPERTVRAREAQRRRRGLRAAAEGLVAAAAGDGIEALRLSQKAERHLDEPLLLRLLKAEAAKASGDKDEMQNAYAAMLGFPETRLLGHRGLMLMARRKGDNETALAHAQEAYQHAKTARWAWQAIFDAQLMAGNWAEAMDLLKQAEKRKLVKPDSAERRRAALLAAEAHAMAADNAGKSISMLQDALKIDPKFVPAAAILVRQLSQTRKVTKAQQTLESAWKKKPHPALALVARDLKSDETPKARAKRLEALAKLNALHRESRMMMTEAAILKNDTKAARAAIDPLLEPAPTDRVCHLMSRIAYAAHEPEEARAWMTKASNSPHEPDWSDMDPHADQFEYTRDDWMRLIRRYGEFGKLQHPRRTADKLDYKVTAPEVSADAAPKTYVDIRPDDPGPGYLDDDLHGREYSMH